MDKQHVKGAIDKTKGAAKDAIGRATGNVSLQAQGKTDKAKGGLRKIVGDIKDAMRRR